LITAPERVWGPTECSYQFSQCHLHFVNQLTVSKATNVTLLFL